jgi:hypothetical protein
MRAAQITAEVQLLDELKPEAADKAVFSSVVRNAMIRLAPRASYGCARTLRYVPRPASCDHGEPDYLYQGKVFLCGRRHARRVRHSGLEG